jgi:hypothetical protein
MANELSINCNYSYSKSNDSSSRSKSMSITVAGTPRISGRQAIGTAEETLSLGDVTALGLIYVENLDATNYVTIGCVSTQRPVKVAPLEGQYFRLDGSAVYIAASASTVDVLYEIFSN